MAVIANGRGNDMLRGFSGGLGTIMATTAASRRNVAVVKNSRSPGSGSVAVITGVACGQMLDGFTHGRGAIVATGTGSEHGGVVHAAYR